MNDGMSIQVARIWRRDESVNLMSLEDAALNLKCNAIPLMIRNWELDAIQERLLTGYAIETPSAVFRVALDGMSFSEAPVLVGGHV